LTEAVVNLFTVTTVHSNSIS